MSWESWGPLFTLHGINNKPPSSTKRLGSGEGGVNVDLRSDNINEISLQLAGVRVHK